jgi:hypothetical protein
LAEAGPFTFVAAGALTMKVREGGKVVNVFALIATGVKTDGRREVLCLRTATAKTGQAWNTFLADLVTRCLNLRATGDERRSRGAQGRNRGEPDERERRRACGWPQERCHTPPMTYQTVLAVNAQFDSLLG